jgi:hypothetical protein
MIMFGSSAMKDDDTDPHTQAYRDAIGDDGRTKNETFMREGIESIDTVTFEISPQMSHVPAEWIAARPGFWKAPSMKTKMTSVTPKESAVKPAALTKP